MMIEGLPSTAEYPTDANGTLTKYERDKRDRDWGQSLKAARQSLLQQWKTDLLPIAQEHGLPIPSWIGSNMEKGVLSGTNIRRLLQSWGHKLPAHTSLSRIEKTLLDAEYHRDLFVTQYKGLIVYCLRHWEKLHGPPPFDADGAAYEGLFKAAETFDPDHGGTFMTLACVAILRNIRTAAIREKKKAFRGRLPSRKATSILAVGISTVDRKIAQAALQSTIVSYDQIQFPGKGRDKKLIDQLEDPREEKRNSMSEMRMMENRELVRRIFERLENRESIIAALRYGLFELLKDKGLLSEKCQQKIDEGHKTKTGGLTLEEIGDLLEISKEGVRKLVIKIRSKLYKLCREVGITKEDLS